MIELLEFEKIFINRHPEADKDLIQDFLREFINYYKNEKSARVAPQEINRLCLLDFLKSMQTTLQEREQRDFENFGYTPMQFIAKNSDSQLLFLRELIGIVRHFKNDWKTNTKDIVL